MTQRVKTSRVARFPCLAVALTVAVSLAPAFGQESSRRLVLEGVVLAANPAGSLALVRLEGAARARTMRIGDLLSGYVLISVEAEKVVLRGPEGEVELHLGDEPEPVAPPPEPSLPDQSQPEQDRAREAEMVSGVTGDSMDGWIRRAFVRDAAQLRLAKEMPVILTETGLTPRVESGEINGLRLTRLPDGTLLSESGLLPGDVLLSINEEPVQSLNALMSLLPTFRSENQIRLVVDRRGETVKLAYDLRD